MLLCVLRAATATKRGRLRETRLSSFSGGSRNRNPRGVWRSSGAVRSALASLQLLIRCSPCDCELRFGRSMLCSRRLELTIVPEIFGCESATGTNSSESAMAGNRVDYLIPPLRRRKLRLPTTCYFWPLFIITDNVVLISWFSLFLVYVII